MRPPARRRMFCCRTCPPRRRAPRRRLYRSVKSEYVLVAKLNAGDRTYLDTGTLLGGLLEGSAIKLQSRLHGGLTIDPGTIVKLNGAGIETGFGAQLMAEGLDGSEVVFTALQDDRYGAGGTFATSDRDDLQPGGWTGLYLGPDQPGQPGPCRFGLRRRRVQSAGQFCGLQRLGDPSGGRAGGQFGVRAERRAARAASRQPTAAAAEKTRKP